MKKQTILIAILVLFLASCSSVIAQQKQDERKKVTITFKNNSILPRKYTFISYWNADRSNNATEGVMLAPYATKTITDVVGTEIFLADNAQINTVMGGKKIAGKAFWVFKNEDNGKTINLRKD